MNFTFTWILDKFGFQPKIEALEDGTIFVTIFALDKQ